MHEHAEAQIHKPLLQIEERPCATQSYAMRFVLFRCSDAITRQQSRRRRLGGQPKKLSSCCHLRCFEPRYYPSVRSSNEAGAKALSCTSKLSFLTGMARPRGRPRKSTGWAALAAVPEGSFTTIFPDLPETSQMRSRVPFKAGDDPKAVTSTPGRETLTPVRTAGQLPPCPAAAAATKGTLV